MLHIVLRGIKTAWQLQSVNLIINYAICIHFNYIVIQSCIFTGIFLHNFSWASESKLIRL